MLSRFYHRFSYHLLGIVVVLFPFLYYQAETLQSNNNIETWLPAKSAVRAKYEEFKQWFGAEEVILVGLTDVSESDPLLESVCERLERLPSIRSCWSPDRLKSVMRNFGVPEPEVESRLKGLVVAEDSKLIGLVAVLSAEGIRDRVATVRDVREQLDYCQLGADSIRLAGAPVVVAELDRLGNRSSNQPYFLLTLVLCLGLLYYSVRVWKLAFAILGLTIWAINCSVAMIHLAGGQTNFILDALPVMVMVFTLAVAVHFLHYYASARGQAAPLATALRLACRPCSLATFTTSIGLVSLAVSDIAPVKQFGCAAAAAAIVALVAGLGLVPAVLTVLKLSPDDIRVHHVTGLFQSVGHWVLDRSRVVTATTLTVVVLIGVGLVHLHSKIDPLDFLPEDAQVLSDVRTIQQDLTSTESIEAVVDFGGRDLTFVQKLDEIRMVEEILKKHPAVRHTMSLASFFPKTLPDRTFELTQLLDRVSRHRGETEYVSDDERRWRISVRTDAEAGISQQQCFEELGAMLGDLPVTLTGIAPLLEVAQEEIFRSFWESFALAFAIISVVMVASLRSWKRGLVAMVPNLTPIALVFGILGWIQFPVDIGMMMTGSIALGLAVDGTFHFLVRYQQGLSQDADSCDAAREALLKTGPPILQATVISSVGMLALTLSNFGPTVRFGYLMATILLAALVGDLVLLPSLLSLRRHPVRTLELPAPHFPAGNRLPRRGRTPALARWRFGLVRRQPGHP